MDYFLILFHFENFYRKHDPYLKYNMKTNFQRTSFAVPEIHKNILNFEIYPLEYMLKFIYYFKLFRYELFSLTTSFYKFLLET